MNEALCSILSGEKEWYFDTEGRYIKFNDDGTGELWCRCNFNYWIAAHFKWNSIVPSRDPGQVTSITQNRTSPQLLGELNLEITLTKQLPQWVQSSILSRSTLVNEYSLTDEAFRPKSYTIRIEKGNFMVPCCVGYVSSSKTPRYGLRMLFDKSPYPPRSQWREPEQGPDDCQFWDHIEFVSRPAPDLERQGQAMNDTYPRGWSECVVS
ncbi:hypothetical protein F5Y13DRAFT_169166 [Hypoxylon sp. FL1857]|nr:hypothetical protein F5Y13DRAFT_169166 [Hypoxylon sp. FL1857]